MATVQQLLSSPTPAPLPDTPTMVADMEDDLNRSAAPTTASTFGSGPQKGDTRIVVIMYGPGQETIVSVFAEVLGKPFRLTTSFAAVDTADQGLVLGIPVEEAKKDITRRDRKLVVAIHAHCVNLGMPPDQYLSEHCDYEFLYTQSPFVRRDLARFISFVLGQIDHHETLMAKPRTYFISTTFPDVRAALPNIDILTVGADAVEIRVDLLKEPLPDGSFSPIPSLSYVGEQVMLLRQGTELPIIFTTRCTRENGRFPMDNPDLYFEYLYRAIQWGVEYIDVELWLPESIRERLYRLKGSSHIMSAFHDFSGTFKWPSPRAESIFVESVKYADIVKMIAIINDPIENFELEYFRSKIRTQYPNAPPLSAVNMGATGQISRTLNTVFTPITHPLLPIIAAPGQMSAAEINTTLTSLGQLPRKYLYAIGSPTNRSSAPHAPFYEKCFNELGLPHHFAVVERHPGDPNSLEAWCNQKNFGGAYLSPAVPFASLVTKSPFFTNMNGGNGPALTEAARVIGVVDTIVVRPASASPASASMPSSPRLISRGGSGSGLGPGGGDLAQSLALDSAFTATNNHAAQSNGGGGSPGGSGLPPGSSLVFDNATWRGILSTLTRDTAPSAYAGRAAVVLAASADDAASAIFALKALRVGKIYTAGFRTPPALGADLLVEPFNSLESLQRARMVSGSGDGTADGSPFVIISALAPDKGNLVGVLLSMFGASAAPQLQPANPSTTTSTATSAAPSTGTAAASAAAPRGTLRKVFLDLADGPRKFGDLEPIARQCGFAAYGAADVSAFTTVETLRLLVGQNVPYSFVRLASGRGLY